MTHPQNFLRGTHEGGNRVQGYTLCLYIQPSAPMTIRPAIQSLLVLLLYVTCLEYRLFRHTAFFFASLIVSFIWFCFRSASFFASSSFRHGMYRSSQWSWHPGYLPVSFVHPLHGHPFPDVLLKPGISFPTPPCCMGTGTCRRIFPAEQQTEAV